MYQPTNITPLIAQELYVPEYKSERNDPTLNIGTINRLLYWGDLVLFNYRTHPKASGGYEQMRNITLTVKIVNLVKKYPDAIVKIPTSFLKESIKKEVFYKQTPTTSEKVLEETSTYKITEKHSTSYIFELKSSGLVYRMPLAEVYKQYLESGLSTNEIRYIDSHEDQMKFSFKDELPDNIPLERQDPKDRGHKHSRIRDHNRSDT